MTIKVYGMPISTCTRRVCMTLEEKNVPYEVVNVDLMKGEHKAPEFIAMQPFGKIPVMVDGDVTLFESRAIMRYIAKKYADQGQDLLGKDAKAEALTDTWVEVESAYYNPPISTIVAEKVFKPWRGGTPDEAVVAAQLEELNKVLDVYEEKLGKTTFIAGDTFTIADITCMSYMEALVNMAKITEPLDKHPKVKAWWQKVSSRPSWVKLTAQ